ncbi:hypothetical protein Cfor_11700 [Coptotermes formosanus]|jgi:hypothetical protein|uniref:Uncharacterized protein n=1 Tax=Coptotermes formosanus TaxID=36987 RepID=A0A6L2PDB3_COPFO|nr:hypothetical protein Cfor_11700 [Coptotermes formosanus]
MLPELRCLYINLATFWFQQDVATAHTAWQSMCSLRTVVEHNIISHYDDIHWPVRSADLSARVFTSWGYLKSKVFEICPAD